MERNGEGVNQIRIDADMLRRRSREMVSLFVRV